MRKKIVLLLGCALVSMEPSANADPALQEGVYPSLSAYVARALGRLPEGYTCAISPTDPDAKGCRGSSSASAQASERTFGMFYTSSAASESGFLFIAEKHGETLSVKESHPFHVEVGAMRYGWGVEDFEADSGDSFHWQTTSGSASMPDTDVYRFKLIDGQWLLSGHDHRTLSRCLDGSIGVGNSYSINFLTRKVRIEFRQDCRRMKATEHQLATRPIPWDYFDPSDPLLDPVAYGVAWDIGQG